ncbi:hypothetical protein ABEY63_25495 [Priestia aryabhattai]|uniref:hypothetical protein n=1 Tax=Priestia aryabhattai TaxID=412384 RepID=UPI003D293779
MTKKHVAQYRLNNCRFGRVEDALLDIMLLLKDEESKKIVEKYYFKIVREEKEKVEKQKQQGK